MTFLEKDLEDYICKHPSVLPLGRDIRILGRQVTLDHGVLDLLATGHYEDISLIELKARAARKKDLAQVLRYKYDLEQIIRDIAINFCMPYQLDDHRPHVKDFANEIFDLCFDGREVKALHPMLIVKNEPNEQFIAAARGAGVSVCGWEMGAGEVHITESFSLQNREGRVDSDTRETLKKTLFWNAWRRIAIKRAYEKKENYAV